MNENLPPPSSTQPSGEWFPSLLFIAGLGSYFLLLYTVRDIINPYVACAIAAFLLFPLRHGAHARRMLWAVVLTAVLWIAYDVSAILEPFLVAFLFAFLCDPLVTRLSRRIPRWISAALILLVLVGFAVMVGMFIIPPVIGQVEQLTRNVVYTAQNLSTWYTGGGLSALLQSFNVPEDRAKSFLADQVAPHVQEILGVMFAAILQFLASGVYSMGKLINIVLLPFLGFYLLKDFPEIKAAVKRLLTAFHAPATAVHALKDIDALVSSFFRAQVLVACITGTLAGTIFYFTGVPYAFLLGLMIAILDVIPYFGLFANMTITTMVVLLAPDPSFSRVVLVIGVLLGLNLLEANVIAPRILGQQVGLHPVAIILSIFVFAHEFGIVGLLVAVPTTAVLTYIVRLWLKNRAAKMADHG